MKKGIKFPTVVLIGVGKYLVTVSDRGVQALAKDVDRETAVRVKEDYIKKQIKKINQ